MSLPQLLSALGVADRYGPAADLERVAYEFVDYYAPKRLLEYAARAPLPLPDEARRFLADYAKTYTPVAFEGDEHA